MIAFCNHLFIKIILNQNLKNNKNNRSMVRQVHSDFEIRFFYFPHEFDRFGSTFAIIACIGSWK
jgi:hypothetical protein